MAVVITLILILSSFLQVRAFVGMFDLVKNAAVSRAQQVRTYLEPQIQEQLETINQYRDETQLGLPSYVALKTNIENIQGATGAKFVYLSRRDATNSWFYVADGYGPDSPLYTPLGTPIEEDYLPLYESIVREGKPIPGNYENGDFGRMISSYFPIKNDQGEVIAVIGTDFDISSEYQAFIDNFLFGMIISLVFTAVAVFIIGLYIQRAINRPVKQMVTAATKIAQGQLSVELNQSRTDEIGLLSTSLNTMAVNMREILSKIKTASFQVSAGAVQVSDSSLSLSNGASTQTSALEKLGNAIHAISDQATHNASDAAEANIKTQNALSSAKEGAQVAKKLHQAMNTLNQSTQQMSQFIKEIDNIAFQTNILALNASVEAARAGELGKGFAVVAQSVRELAERAARSAKETSQILESTSTQTKLGTQLADSVSESLSNISTSVDQSSILVTSIANDAIEQSKSMANIKIHIGEISAIVHQNSATAEETAASSEEL